MKDSQFTSIYIVSCDPPVFVWPIPLARGRWLYCHSFSCYTSGPRSTVFGHWMQKLRTICLGGILLFGLMFSAAPIPLPWEISNQVSLIFSPLISTANLWSWHSFSWGVLQCPPFSSWPENMDDPIPKTEYLKVGPYDPWISWLISLATWESMAVDVTPTPTTVVCLAPQLGGGHHVAASVGLAFPRGSPARHQRPPGRGERRAWFSTWVPSSAAALMAWQAASLLRLRHTATPSRQKRPR